MPSQFWPRVPSGDRSKQAAAVVAVVMTLLLATVAIPFGGVLRGALVVVQVAVLLCAVVVLLQARRIRHLSAVAWPAGALALLALFGFFQTLPLPCGWVETLSPGLGEVYACAPNDVEPGAAEPNAADPNAVAPNTAAPNAVEPDGAARSPSLTVSPKATRATSLHILALSAALLVAGWVGRRREYRRLWVVTFTLAALAQVVYGIHGWATKSSRILGLEVLGESDRLRGTFVNPDHLALYLEIALPLLLAMVVWGWHKGQRVQELERRIALVAVPALLWVGLFVGLAFSGSRAGLLAAAAGFAMQILLLVSMWGWRRGWKVLALGGAVVVLGLVGVLASGARRGLGRLLSTSSYEVTWNARFDTYRATWELWKDYPISGTGLGTFREVFPLAQPRSLAGWWWHAHSDALELLLTGGLIAVVIMGIGCFFLARRLWWVLRTARRSEDRLAAVAAFGALTSVGLHEVVDFGLTMPANAFTLAILCGAAAAVRLPRDQPRHEVAPRP